MVASDPVSGDNLFSVDMEFVKPRFLVVPEIQSSIHSSFCREGFLCVVLENPVAGGDGVTEEVRVRNFKFNLVSAVGSFLGCIVYYLISVDSLVSGYPDKHNLQSFQVCLMQGRSQFSFNINAFACSAILEGL